MGVEVGEELDVVQGAAWGGGMEVEKADWNEEEA